MRALVDLRYSPPVLTQPAITQSVTDTVVLSRLGALDPFGENVVTDPASLVGVCGAERDGGVIFNSCI